MKIKNTIILFSCLVFLALTIPAIIFYIVFRQLPISTQVQDWSNFGSYIGGVYSALFGFLSTVVVCLTLYFTINYNKEQINHMKKQHLSNLINLYASTLNQKLDNKIYEVTDAQSGRRVKMDEEKFLFLASTRYNLNHDAEVWNHKNKNPDDTRNFYPNVLIIGSETLQDLDVNYNSEIGNLITILDLINSEENNLSRKELLNQFQAVTYRNRMFWIMLYAYFNVPSARESIAFNEGLLIAAEGISRSSGCATS